MGKKSNTDPRWEGIEKTIKRLDYVAVILVCLMAVASLAAIGTVVLSENGLGFVAAWGYVKWAFLFYLGNVVFDSAASALDFWENNEKNKVQKASYHVANGEHRVAPVSGADAVNSFINDKN